MKLSVLLHAAFILAVSSNAHSNHELIFTVAVGHTNPVSPVSHEGLLRNNFIFYKYKYASIGTGTNSFGHQSNTFMLHYSLARTGPSEVTLSGGIVTGYLRSFQPVAFLGFRHYTTPTTYVALETSLHSTLINLGKLL